MQKRLLSLASSSVFPCFPWINYFHSVAINLTFSLNATENARERSGGKASKMNDPRII